MKVKLQLLLLIVMQMVACTGIPEMRHWKAEPCAVAGERPNVPVYEVEFLPVVPTVPGTFIVGKLLISDNAALNYENEEYVQAVKELAADMGGNTIVYPHTGVTEAVVAYVPLEEVNYHGGDEFLIDAGVLSPEL